MDFISVKHYRSIIQTKKFLEMPSSYQNLYFHLVFNSDENGYVEALPVIRMTSNDELGLEWLENKGYIKKIDDELRYYIYG